MVQTTAPLAERIRPKTLDEFVGQEPLIGSQGIIRKMIESDQLFSMIFWGPAGCGKTTLAQVIANTTRSYFLNFSAVTTKLADIRRVVKEAKERWSSYQQRTILFLDEIHRFNKAQQDTFLPHVEKGTLILIGATTENPSFEVIGPLLSRCRVFVLEPLNCKHLNLILERGLKELNREIDSDAKELFLSLSNSDARVLLNALEIADSIDKTKKKISVQLIKQVFQKQALIYDRLGEEHYNTISAFIKSMRASNVDAALYYLGRIVEAGEDPLFIARRMVIFASEDIGIVLPTALVVANAVFRACETIGYPECALNLAHGVVYLTKAPKNRSAYNALNAVLEDIRQHGNLPVPLNLRNAPTKLMKDLGYGQGYEKYTKEDLLPEKLRGRKYYGAK
jgi:putative ATPase